MVLAAGLFGRAVVRVQLSFGASEISLPEPDVAVVPLGSHSQAHPSAAYLVIEVSSTSLRAEREVKAALYAAAGVPEYWVVDVVAPSNVSPIPDVRIVVADIF